MRSILKVVAVAAIAAAAVAVPTAAHAADGYVYAYKDAYFVGPYCKWVGNDADWGTCSPAGSMLNTASSLWNNGYAGGYDDVNFYWGKSYTGAWDCLGVGTSWSNLQNQRFVYGAGKAGYGQSTNDNIASHKWVPYCGHP